jgi:hypothetical protein
MDSNVKFWSVIFFVGAVAFVVTNPGWISGIVLAISALGIVMLIQSIRMDRRKVSELVADGLSADQARRKLFDDKARTVAEDKKRQDDVLKLAGSEMINVVLINGLTNVRVKVFKNGYVKVGDRPLEKLISVSASMENLGKKSAAGRAAGFLVTGGLNMLSPNKRGDVTLTIATEHKVHVIHTDYPTETQIKGVLAVETAGKAAISRQKSQVNAADNHGFSGTRDIGQSLESLAELHSKGQLTDDEFTAAKKRLLDS